MSEPRHSFAVLQRQSYGEAYSIRLWGKHCTGLEQTGQKKEFVLSYLPKRLTTNFFQVEDDHLKLLTTVLSVNPAQ